MRAGLLVFAVSILYAGSLFSQNHIVGSQSPSPTSLEKELRQADLHFARQTATRHLESMKLEVVWQSRTESTPPSGEG
jgi:hypothetical protein